MAKTEAPGVSNDTKEMIENQVKKGQPRKFFLIYKGSNIKTLVVFKKGPFGPKIMQAKKDGFKGDVAYGIVRGSGQNLFFQLPGNGDVAEAMKVDSWEEEPPTKEVKLRAFLIDNGLPFKAKYAIITEASNVLAPEADTGNPVGPSPESSDAARFTARLKALKPDVSNVIAAQNSMSQDVRLLASEAAEFARQGDFGEANLVLDQLAELLEQGLAEMKTVARPAGDPETLFTARLKRLIPEIKQAADTPHGDEAKLRASEAGVMARKKEFARANELLDLAERALKDGAPGTNAPSDVVAIWRQAKDSVDEQLNRFAGVMRQTGHPYLQKIADTGLHRVTEDPSRVFVGLQASLIDFVSLSGDGRSQAADKVQNAITQYRDFLRSNKAIDICDANKLCGPLTLRKTLQDALQQVERLVST